VSHPEFMQFPRRLTYSAPVNTKAHVKQPPLQSSVSGYTEEQENDLVRFAAPNDGTPEQQALVADIVALDHRSLRRLGVRSPIRQEIKRLLWNASNVGFIGTESGTNEGRLLYQKAELAYFDFIQVRNRLRFLLGMGIGTVVTAILGSLLAPRASFLEPYVASHLLGLLMLFAGLGSITSVLGRLTSIDLRQETSDAMLVISGAAKPLVAIVLAIVVFLILDLKIVEIHVGNAEGERANGLFLITSFLCGFSERFASDIIARVPFAGGSDS
jgi:hypothetical protein